MCGIVGIMTYGEGGAKSWHYKVFRDLLYVDAARGMHGTGVFGVTRSGSIARVKVGGPPSQLLGTKEYDSMERFILQRQARFVTGHNRYATKGQKNTANAHPFVEGSITLVHNGTLENYNHLPDYKKYDVDSQLLAHAIDVDGIDKTIENLEGAWTLVYWNAKDKTLNILRNEERPLYMAFHEGEKFYAYASEREMLEWCLKRNFYSTAVIESVPIDTHLSFSLDEFKPKTRELKGKFVPKKQQYLMYEEAYDLSGGSCGETTCTAETSRDVNEPPPVKVNQNKGEWGRGGTGQVGQVHLLQPPKKPKKQGVMYTSVKALHDLVVDKMIDVQVANYDKVDGPASDMYKFDCFSPDYPDVEFIVNIRGEKRADDFIEATYGLKGRIFQIMKSSRPPAELPHRVILHDPSPINTQPLTVVH